MAIINTTNNSNVVPQGDYLQFKDMLVLCMSKWRWFLLSLALFIGMAWAYILVTPSVYKRSASLLIKDNNKKSQGLGSEQNPFQDISLFTTSTNVQNELICIQSPDVLLEVIRRLHLDMEYMVDGKFHKELLYGSSLPVEVNIEKLSYNDDCSFTLTIQKNREIQLSGFSLNGQEIEGDSIIKATLKKPVDTPVGRLTVTPTPYFKQAAQANIPICVSRMGLLGCIGSCQGSLQAELTNDKATIIELTYTDRSIQRAEDFLNTLISVYNENWVKDRNQIAVSTSLFINERLQVIENELGHVDSDISSYKSANLVPDVEAASQMYMNTANQASVQLTDLSNQLYMARYVRDYVSNKNNTNQLLPANSGIHNSAIEQQIKEYNSKQLQRNSLVANSSDENPLVVDIDKQLGEMRSAIVSSIDNQVNTLNTQIRGVQSIQGASTSRIASNPTQAKYLLSVERQQKVKEALYLFLLQKREENELSQAFTAYNTRLVKSPFGDLGPTAPNRRRIILGAILLGLLIPVVLIYIRENLNTKIRGRKDLERLTVPFIGEIPLYKKSKKGFSKSSESYDILVKPGNRNIINEAFRVVRTNLEFMNGSDQGCKVIMVTSLNPGTGKTFLTINLAASFAIKDKKVAVLDLDMRRATLSNFVHNPETGVSDYLNGRVSNWRETMTAIESHKNMDVIPVGTIPPNPAELLFSDRMKELIEGLRKSYNMIFLDCPPVELVADASVISKLADVTVFAIRAGLLERDLLPVIEGYYQDKKFHNMSILLNGTTAVGGRYGYHRYGYHYGYAYGYGSKGYGGYTKE